MRLLMMVCAAFVVALSVGPVRATTYTFAGTCSDCTGSSGSSLVTATLILTGDTPGQPLDASNFVSFSYDGSDKAPAFVVQYDGYPLEFSALFLDEATQMADVHLHGKELNDPTGWDFTTAADGSFNLAMFGTNVSGGAGGVDQGTDAIWTNAAATVPEAPSFTLVGAGLVAALAASRRRPVRLG